MHDRRDLGPNCLTLWPRGYKTSVQSQTQNKAQWLAACGHVFASSQSLHFILSLRMNSSFITSRPDCIPEIVFFFQKNFFLRFFKHFIVCGLLNSHMGKVNGQCMHKSPDLSEDFFSYSIEYRVKKGEFRVIKVEYRVIKVEYRVIKVEYRVMKVEYRVIKVEYRVIKSEYRVIKSEYRVIKSEYRVIKLNKKTIGCSTRSHTWRSHGIKKTYFKKSHDK